MRILVTGGAGFIGTNLIERLLRDEVEVVAVDDLSDGKRERVPSAAIFHELDICETSILASVMEKVDVVVHLAALPRVQFTIDHPLEAQRVNVDGTLSVLEAARTAGVQRVIFATSSAVYGDQEMMPLVETMPVAPKSPYALHKYYGELLMKLWSEIYGLKTVSLRFFNVYGPHMDPNGAYALVIPRFLKQRQENSFITITGDGEQTRDFIHVEDVVEAIMCAAVNDRVGNGEVFNIGSGEQVTINHIAHLIGGPIEHLPPRLEPRHTLSDCEKAHEVLGWKPSISLHQGILALKRELGLM